MWFGKLPTSIETTKKFHYKKIERYNSAQEHSQETQFPIHPNSLSLTRQENTILLLMWVLLGFQELLFHQFSITTYHKARTHTHTHTHTHIYVTLSSWLLGFQMQLVFDLDDQIGLWQFKPHGPSNNKSPPWLESIKLHQQTPPSPPPQPLKAYKLQTSTKSKQPLNLSIGTVFVNILDDSQILFFCSDPISSTSL